MNKKEARRSKHEAEKRRNRDILDSSIIGGDDDAAEFSGEEAFQAAQAEEQEETLLGNLAEVEHIPVLPWRFPLPVLPLVKQTLNLPSQEDDDWITELFREIAGKDHDIIGFMPLLNEKSVEGIARDVQFNRIGVAAQVREVKTTEVGTHLIDLQGLCRFEIIDLAFTEKKATYLNVRWFEDDEEPDEILLPLHEQFNGIVQRLAKMRGQSLRFYQDIANYPKYVNHAVQYSSFMFLDHVKYDWFTFEEQVKLMRLTSTSERMQMVIERAEKMIPVMEKRWESERRRQVN